MRAIIDPSLLPSDLTIRACARVVIANKFKKQSLI
jgi:hypothetical protein